jgi:hypothetical protein
MPIPTLATRGCDWISLWPERGPGCCVLLVPDLSPLNSGCKMEQLKSHVGKSGPVIGMSEAIYSRRGSY